MLRVSSLRLCTGAVLAVALAVAAPVQTLAANPAPPRNAQLVEGKDVMLGVSAPLGAFLRWQPLPNGTVHVDAWELRNGIVIAAYDTDMTKLMHMIVVSDDLTDFQHVHPALLPNGHFVIDVRLAHPGQAYHVYSDGMPHSNGRHTIRFDIPSSGAPRGTARSLHPAGPSADVGPYRVTISPTSIPFGEIATIQVQITKNGKPADDLHPYLGMMSHGVLIGTNDLAYMHAHGMTQAMLDMASDSDDCGDGMLTSMPPMPPNVKIGNTFEFQVLAPAEPYDFWIQFIGGSTLYTTPLLVAVR